MMGYIFFVGKSSCSPAFFGTKSVGAEFFSCKTYFCSKNFLWPAPLKEETIKDTADYLFFSIHCTRHYLSFQWLRAYS